MTVANTTVITKTFQFKLNLAAGLTVTQAAVKIYGVSDSAPVLLADFDSQSSSFNREVKIATFGYFYIVTTIEKYQYNGSNSTLGKNNVQLLGVFDVLSDSVGLSEQSTIANAFCFARFTTITAQSDIAIAADDRTLAICYAMKNNFSLIDGSLSNTIKSAPNGLQTNSYPLFNFLSNLMFYGIVNDDIYQSFLSLSSPTTPNSTFYQGLLNLVYQPFTNVESIYNLISKQTQIFTPSLATLTLQPKQSPIPEQWSLTIKVNDSGAQNFLIGGPAFLVFDKNDRAWVTNNVRQGTPNSSNFCVVLEPDGKPSNFSPLFGGGLLGAAFGVAVDNSGENIFIGNYGWGSVDHNPQTGSISAFTSDGNILSPPNGYTNKLARVQGMCFDSKGNLWMCSSGSQQPMAPAAGPIYNFASVNSAVVVYLDGDPNKAIAFEFDSPYFATFDVVIDSEDNAFVSNSGYKGEKGKKNNSIPSSVYKFCIKQGEIKRVNHWDSDYQNAHKPNDDGQENFKQIQLNSSGSVFVAAVGSNRVVELDNQLNYVKQYTTNISAPWGVTIDRDDTLYVANFSAVDGSHGVTVIHNADDSTAKLMTLPTGGEEVTLANGFPLYGNIAVKDKTLSKVKCFDPLMRLTATVMDRAGNLWAISNWKPSTYVDIKQNPGGDGIVIFVGAAQPKP